MADQVLLYISAAADLQHERDILGQAVTEIPTSLGWRVVLSPGSNDVVDLDAVLNAGVHLLLLGGDIRAPVGLEWTVARRASRMPLPFYKTGILQTSAARSFIRDVAIETTWQPFSDGEDLRRKALRVLVDHILQRVVYYALSLEETERLQIWRADLDKSSAPSETHGGTGESSVILSRDHIVTSGGILIEPNDKKAKS